MRGKLQLGERLPTALSLSQWLDDVLVKHMKLDRDEIVQDGRVVI